MTKNQDSESIRADKATVFLENFINDNFDWISSWLLKRGNEALYADMLFLQLNKYHFEDGYYFNKNTAKIVLDLFYKMPGGKIAAGIVLNSYIENNRKIPAVFSELHSDILLNRVNKFSEVTANRTKDRRDYLLAWLTHLLNKLFHLPLSPRSNRKSEDGNTAVEIVHKSLSHHFNDHGFGNITARAVTKALTRFTDRYPFIANI
jgi:hypothetical protein